jgi:hypothetical protein
LYGLRSVGKVQWVNIIKWYIVTMLNAVLLLQQRIVICHHNPPALWCICPILAHSTIMRKWKWLSVNGFKCKSLIYTVTEFKLIPRWDKCIKVLEDCVEKWWYLSAIKTPHLVL